MYNDSLFVSGLVDTNTSEILSSSDMQPPIPEMQLSLDDAIPQPPLVNKPTLSEVHQVSEAVDPGTCPIIAGQEVYLEIQKGKSGLGLSIVGGSYLQGGLPA